METQRAMKISALVDGEVDEHEAEAAIRASLDDPERWRTYWLIGESLRGESAPVVDLTATVMARVAEEPVVLAPRNLREQRPRPHPLLALAASIAGVVVVGWVALGDVAHPVGNGTVKIAAAPSPVRNVVQQRSAEAVRKFGAGGTASSPVAADAVPPASATSAQMQEYLLAHQAQAATVRLAEPVRQIRTVALTAPQRP